MKKVGQHLTHEQKVKLLAKYFAKERLETDEQLDMLFELEDIAKEAYEKNKRHSFSLGVLKANEAVLNAVF